MRYFIIATISALLTLLILASCGIKAPPLPPLASTGPQSDVSRPQPSPTAPHSALEKERSDEQ